MDTKTADIIAYFKKINEIPRCSKNEKRLSLWLEKWAESRGFSVNCDSVGNMVISVPATGGYENAPVIVLQGHMDMVCEKTKASLHDFTTDPVPVIVDGEWLKAKDTTLGADNGIALAMGLALADDESAAHPPLELLFTVDEETGLNGVAKLAPDLFKGKMLINLDSEDEGIFVAGCAGSNNTTIKLDFAMATSGHSNPCYDIHVFGLKGGHSGIDIGKGRANACKLMAQTLAYLLRNVDMQIVSISGGSARNVIPRRAEAVISCNAKDEDLLFQTLTLFREQAQSGFGGIEPHISIHIEKTATDMSVEQPLLMDDTKRLVNLLMSLPTGPHQRSVKDPGNVKTSSNLAMISMKDGCLEVISSQRSSVPYRLDQLSAIVEAVGKLSSGRVETNKGYPAWLQAKDSTLLNRAITVYEDLFNRKPDVRVMHAGLECAVIGSKYEDMDMISVGPTIENPHSPSERLYIPSIGLIWRFLVALMASFKP